MRIKELITGMTVVLFFISFPLFSKGVAEEPVQPAPQEVQTPEVAPADSSADVTDAYEDIKNDFLNQGFSVAKEILPLVDFELKNLDDQRVKLSDFNGKVVMLNFWASWCGPCKAEMPSMEELYKEYRESGFEIVAVNLQESKATVEKFRDDYGLTFPILLDQVGSAGAIYGARSIPTSYFIDRNGNVISMTVGTREWATAEFRSLLEKLLAL